MKHFYYLIVFIIPFKLFTQETQPIESSNWDNNMYISNKVTYGSSEKLKHSAEFQTRFKDDLGALEQWYIEYAASYLVNKNWEIVPDFRFTKKPDRVEYRPGLGAIYKNIFEETKTQLVHQVKYQYDLRNGQNDSHGLRYAIFYNKVINDELVLTGLMGGLFEFGKDFNGFLGLRTGVSAAYVFNKAHSINVGYFYGLVNDKTNHFNHIGVISFQLVINISRDYKYLPAKYFSL